MGFISLLAQRSKVAHLTQKTGGWVSRVYPDLLQKNSSFCSKKIAVLSDCSIQVVVILDTSANSSSYNVMLRVEHLCKMCESVSSDSITT